MSEDFAIGPPAVNMVRRRPREQPVLHFGRIVNSKFAGDVTRVKFNPLSIDERYAKSRCPLGMVRVFRPFLTSLYLEQRFGYADMELIKGISEMDKDTSSFNQSFTTPTSIILPEIDVKISESQKRANDAANVWIKNLIFRFQMRRLLTAWLCKKSQAKIHPIPNFQTLEEPDETALDWIDIQSRCIYKIDGYTLIKSIEMYLLASSWGTPEPIAPRNPMTNNTFHLGQLVSIFFKIYEWCGKNKKRVPPMITKFHEAKFSLRRFLMRNRPELVMNASRELFKDMGTEDAVEQWLDVVTEYINGIHRARAENDLLRWVATMKTQEEKNLLESWRRILPDIIQYERFNYFIRPEWTEEGSITALIKVLWTATEKYFPRVPIQSIPPLSASVQELIASRINALAHIDVDHLYGVIDTLTGSVEYEVSSFISDSKENEDSVPTPLAPAEESVPSPTAPSIPLPPIPLPPIPIPSLVEPLPPLVNEITSIISERSLMSQLDIMSELALSNDEMAYNLSMFSLYSALNNN